MDLIERAEQSAAECEKQGFFATARSLRDLAAQMRQLNLQSDRFIEALVQRTGDQKPHF